MENFELFYNVIEKSINVIEKNSKLNYIEAFYETCINIYMGEMSDSIKDEKAINELLNVYKELETLDIKKSDVRKALQLMILKSFKDENKKIEITPDSISILIYYILDKFEIENGSNILDPMCGTSNLLSQIALLKEDNHKFIGIDNDYNMIKVSEAVSNILSIETTYYYQDISNKIDEVVDAIVSDLPNQVNELGEYLPLKAILSHIDNVKEGAPIISIIPNNFFDRVSKESIMESCNLEGLIKLPDDMFVANNGKSILILSKKCNTKRTEFLMLDMHSITDRDVIMEAKDVITNFFNRR